MSVKEKIPSLSFSCIVSCSAGCFIRIHLLTIEVSFFLFTIKNKTRESSRSAVDSDQMNNNNNSNALQTTKFSLFDVRDIDGKQTSHVAMEEKSNTTTTTTLVWFPLRISSLNNQRSKRLVPIMGPSLRNISYSCDSHCSVQGTFSFAKSCSRK